MSYPTIDNWSILIQGDTKHLVGTIKGHPDSKVGVSDVSITSPIVGKCGLRVKTQSGTVYQLLSVRKGVDALRRLRELPFCEQL
jgi:hypothetical protein